MVYRVGLCFVKNQWPGNGIKSIMPAFAIAQLMKLDNLQAILSQTIVYIPWHAL